MHSGSREDGLGKRQADSVDEAIGLRIRAVRRERGISQTVLGNAVGLSFQQIQKYERGASRMPASVLIQIARALDIELDGLIEGDPGAFPRISDAPQAVPSDAEVDALTRAFATLQDPELRSAVLRLIARMADSQPD